jgi:hypothetical protein
VREGGWQQVEVASVLKMTVEENGIVGIRIGLRRYDYLNCSNNFNDRDLTARIFLVINVFRDIW